QTIKNSHGSTAPTKQILLISCRSVIGTLNSLVGLGNSPTFKCSLNLSPRPANRACGNGGKCRYGYTYKSSRPHRLNKQSTNRTSSPARIPTSRHVDAGYDVWSRQLLEQLATRSSYRCRFQPRESTRRAS